MIVYTVKKTEVEGEEDMVVKVGQTHEFKMSSVQAHMTKLEKGVTQNKAQIALEAAKMGNVSSFHPIVSTLTMEQMVAVSVYAQAKATKEQCEKQLAEIETLQAEYKAEIEEIKKQTGLELPIVGI